MNAFPAAKRTLLLLLSLAFLVSVPALADEGEGYLGVMLQDLSPSMAKALQMGDQSGVLINEVVEDSPAEEAGLRDGDIILVFAGKDTPDPDALGKAVRKTDPGQKVDVVVLRDGKKKTLSVEVGENENNSWTFAFGGEDGEHMAPHADIQKWIQKEGGDVEFFGDSDVKIKMLMDGEHSVMLMGEDRGYMGVHLDDLNGQLGEYFGVDDGEGALITEVIEDSPAAAAGLKAGDVIIELGGEDIESTSDLHAQMAETEPDQALDLKVVRKGDTKSLNITLGEMPEGTIMNLQNVFIHGDDAHSGGPRMLKKFGHGDGDGENEYIIQRRISPDRNVQLKRLHQGSGDLDELREELDELRQELKALRKDLQDND